jgi:riboflavin synthase
MFTGLVAATGTIASITPTAGATRIVVAAPTLAPQLRLGDSIAVSGVCLTALDLTPETFTADLAAETLARTTLGSMRPGSSVNLELPTQSGSPLGGHVVQGHVDGVGTLLALEALRPEHLHSTDWRMAIAVPASLARFIVPQGSITVEGISLTVALYKTTADGAEIEIAIIPHTYKSTNLHTLRPGSPVNLETDVLARYASQQAVPDGSLAAPAAARAKWLTVDYLLANGY